MLKQRLMTAAILATAAALGILAFPTSWFGGALLVLILVGAWEWSKLLFPPLGQWLYCAVVAVAIGSAWYWLESPAFVNSTVALTCLYWCFVVYWLWRYTVTGGHNSALIWALAGVLTLAPTWIALMALHSDPAFGPAYVLFLVGLVATADSSAYFAGRRWGRSKLAPRLSPGKTCAGVIGAFAAATLLAMTGAALQGSGHGPAFLVVCLVTVGFSIVGDLLESMLKRQHAAKDSGSLLPGHGGILDRLDSLTAAAPIFFFGLAELLW